MSTPSVWTWLSEPGGPHWKTLKRDFVPEPLLNLITTPPELVLDVGCFCGAVGGWLKAKFPNVRVIGIEPVEEAANEARKQLDAVVLGKLEDVNLSGAGVAPGSLDVIVLSDVLEHMYNPWQALVKLRPLLKPRGVVLASIPNVRNYTILAQLVQGDFAYAGAGILDITHIRFFSWKGIQRLFGETGYKIEQATRNMDPRSLHLLEGLKQPPPISIDSPFMQIKNQTHEQLTELATMQYWLRASSV
jgi:2-polyprenyl-3-methyl-5-hydroxy-6-metoxy-1,4-benzoquinol methylase